MKNLLFFSLLAFLFTACRSDQKSTISTADYFKNDDSKIQTGGQKTIEIETPGGKKYKVWTKRFGNNPKIKILLLHGGPACTHEYFESFEGFLPQEGIEFIYYDQLGSAYSDQPKDTSLWDLPRFVEEVEQVRKALNLSKDNFYLLGHSWGGILAAEYALKYQQNLKGLIISNMMMSIPDYNDYAREVLFKQMDVKVLDTILQIEKRGDFSNPKYMALLNEHHYKYHICRMPVAEWPDAVNRTFKNLNYEIYLMMQGPSELGASGKLLKWDRVADLPKITVPTLVIGATHDTMDPKHMEMVAEKIPNAQFLLCPDGSHMSMWDDQKHYFPGLISFLKSK